MNEHYGIKKKGAISLKNKALPENVSDIQFAITSNRKTNVSITAYPFAKCILLPAIRKS